MNEASWNRIGEQQYRHVEAGDQITGLLISRETTVLGVQLYHIIPEGEPQTKAVLGTQGLDRLMEDVVDGQEVMITLVQTVSTRSGSKFKEYQVFSRNHA